MWIDENGVTHSVWVPPGAILGEDAATALRSVPRDVADAALAELDPVAMSIREEAAQGAPPGPAEFDDIEDLAYPPVFPGLAPRDGEALSATVLRFLAEVPAEWRVEALEAVYDVLEPPDDGEDDDEEDDEFESRSNASPGRREQMLDAEGRDDLDGQRRAPRAFGQQGGAEK